MSGISAFLKLILLLAWLGSMGWLIRYEAFPHWFEDTVQGYRTLTRDMPAVRDSWMKIYSGDVHVGYANSTVELEEVDGREDLVLKSQFQLMVEMPDAVTPLRVSSAVHIRNQHQLSHFEVQFHFQRMQGHVEGRRVEGDVFEVELSAGNAQMRRRVTIPPDVVLNSPFAETAMRNLRPGQQLRMRTLDPLSLSGETREMVLRGGGSGKITLRNGSEHEARRMTMTVGDMTVNVWINEHGMVLKQETPFGLTMEAGEVSEAIRIPEENALNVLDLLGQPGLVPLQSL
jgi:hypothetical protein